MVMLLTIATIVALFVVVYSTQKQLQEQE